jgi:EAL and modified HD-GYP domain-containing signal transduction protein
MAEPSYTVISDIIQKDMGLSYKILKLANSAYVGSRKKINSIRHALSFLGFKEIYQWVSLMLLKDLQSVENSELIKLSMIRGKLMELIGMDTDKAYSASEYFFTGMFSFIDVLLNKKMEEVLETLPLPQVVKEALLGEGNELSAMLSFIVACEKADWNNAVFAGGPVDSKKLMTFYLDALKWANKLNY